VPATEGRIEVDQVDPPAAGSLPPQRRLDRFAEDSLASGDSLTSWTARPDATSTAGSSSSVVTSQAYAALRRLPAARGAPNSAAGSAAGFYVALHRYGRRSR
jgi:hypothetical protein